MGSEGLNNEDNKIFLVSNMVWFGCVPTQNLILNCNNLYMSRVGPGVHNQIMGQYPSYHSHDSE